MLESLTPSSPTPICCHPFLPTLSLSGLWDFPFLSVSILLVNSYAGVPSGILARLPTPAPLPHILLPSQRTASLGALPLLCKLFPRKPPADAHNAANGGGEGQCLDRSPAPMSTKNFILYVSHVLSFHMNFHVKSSVIMKVCEN